MVFSPASFSAKLEGFDFETVSHPNSFHALQMCSRSYDLLGTMIPIDGEVKISSCISPWTENLKHPSWTREKSKPAKQI